MSELGEDRRGAVIGRGRTAEVYKWGDEQALKLFHDDLPEARVRRESRVAAVLSALAVSAPRFDGAIEIAGRRGLLFERVAGPTMLALLVRRPWLVSQLAQQFADLHVRIHHQVGSDLPPQRAYLAGLIAAAPDVPSEMRQAALKRLSSLPEGTAVCHGDFHPDNVIMAGHGPVVIDWMAAVRGEPAADVARTLLLAGASLASAWNQSDCRNARAGISTVLRTAVLASVPRSVQPHASPARPVAIAASGCAPGGRTNARRATARLTAPQR
jgi:hypothetical protein